MFLVDSIFILRDKLLLLTRYTCRKRVIIHYAFSSSRVLRLHGIVIVFVVVICSPCSEFVFLLASSIQCVICDRETLIVFQFVMV